jgi:hypothetical protein
LNKLVPAFEQLITTPLESAVVHLSPTSDRLIDSPPVMLAKGASLSRPCVTKEVAGKGFCASKKAYNYGVKLHTIALRRSQQLPLTALLHLAPRFPT